MILRPLHISLLVSFLCFLWTSCQKDKRDYNVQLHQLPTELALTDVYFISADTGFVTAGNLFSAGLVYGTTDAGLHWDTLLQTGQGCNSISYHKNQLCISECGNKFHFTDDFVNWSYYSSSGWWRWHQHTWLPDDQLILVGGGNFGDGHIHQKEPGNNKLVRSDSIQFELMDISYCSNGKLITVGYGLIMTSVDAGLSWQISPVEGDFFRGVDFPTNQTGYVVGEYGSVYKTTNNGQDWQKIRAANSIFSNQSTLLRDIAFINEQTGLIVGRNNTVLRTDNGGKSWQKVENLTDPVDINKITIAYNKAYLAGDYGKLLILNLDN